MNTPNKLTVLRMILVPFFLVLLFVDFPHHYFLADLIFVAASLTDLYDGKLARKNNQITNFGKFLDPLADKVLVISALIAFVGLNLCSPVAVIIIVARELLVTSIRLVAMGSSGTVIAANFWGKMKTTTQMIAIISVMVFQEAQSMDLFGVNQYVPYNLLGAILIWISVLFTAVSGYVYYKENRQFISASK